MRDLCRRVQQAMIQHRRDTGVELDLANFVLVIHPHDWTTFLQYAHESEVAMFAVRQDGSRGLEVITSVADVEEGLPELQSRWKMVV